jgi:DNA-binding transcriptional ArsR family regulator
MWVEDEAIPEIYLVESIEQMRALADALRLRVLELLAHRAMTATQLSAALGEQPAKVHYHVRELERVGLVALVETREKGGILEKYYRAVARSITVPPTLFSQVAPDEGLAVASEYLGVISQGFLRVASTALRERALEGGRAPLLGVTSNELWLTREEMHTLVRELQRLVEPYTAPRGVPDEREVTLATIHFQTPPEEAEEAAPPATAPAPVRRVAPVRKIAPVTKATSDASPAGDQHVRSVVVVGAVEYERAELERIVARGEALSVNIVGYCAFARDVPALLVERAIARFRCRGVLRASDEVRAVLAQKGEVV